MRTTVIISLFLAAGSLAGCNTSAARGEPPPPAKQQAPPAVATTPGPTPSAAGATLTGSDVYRINCQACHGPAGAGTAQAPALRSAAQSLAAGGDDGSLRQRLGSGGQRMPAFPHLTRPEVDALVAYLTEVGGGEAAEAPTVVALTGAAFGEGIYRSNCAACHEAGGTASMGMMCRPANLAGATRRFSKEQVMNLLDVGVGPMPAFAHLATDERDALWAYLDTLSGEPSSRPTTRPSSRPTMGEMCPMVQAAMEGRPMPGMMGGGMMGGGMMGRGMMGRGMMGRGMMGGRMMRSGMGCPMMRTDPPSTEREDASSGMPPCCR